MAATTKLAACPFVTVTGCGWLVMDGDAITVRNAMELVTLPSALLIMTE